MKRCHVNSFTSKRPWLEDLSVQTSEKPFQNVVQFTSILETPGPCAAISTHFLGEDSSACGCKVQRGLAGESHYSLWVFPLGALCTKCHIPAIIIWSPTWQIAKTLLVVTLICNYGRSLFFGPSAALSDKVTAFLISACQFYPGNNKALIYHWAKQGR